MNIGPVVKMDTSYSNTCSILYNREILKNSTSCNQLISDRLSRRNDLLYKRDLIAHFGCVNAVEFSSNGQYLVSGGDDRRVLLWNVQKALHNCGKPTVMESEHHSNIFCLAFDNSVSHIYSAGNDNQVILHDMETCKVCDVFNLEHPVYGISVDPCNDNIFASAGEDGRILIFDTRLNASSDPYKLASFKSPFHAVMFNPIDPRLITTANSKEGAALWDIRVSNKILLQYGRRGSCMNVRWDQTGTRILALRRRQIPILYEINNSKHIAQFFHENYYNSCTMKSCCFAGLKDEFVLSGSDDFNLYMWKISDAMRNENSKNNAHLVLKGHRSIVNQVRFDPYNCVIASSGVEKLIKIWSPLPLPDGTQSTSDWIRKRYTHDEYVSLLLRSGQFMSHDYSEQSTSEDPQMMAFFDSLVQRERDGLASESDDDSSGTSLYTSIECFEDTDYSSLSEDLNVPTTRAVVRSIPIGVDNENTSSSSEDTANSEEENTETAESSQRSSHRRRSKSSTTRSLGIYFRATENDDQTTLSSSSSSSSSSSLSSSSSSSSSSTSSASSRLSKNVLQSSSRSEEETNTNKLTRKRKSKSSVKEALQRLKRVRSAALQSLPSVPSHATDPAVSDRSSGSSSGLEVCASNGGTSTDTLDSGVYVYSSPPRPKYKFTLFKKNQKRKYRTRQPSYSSSSSSSDSA